MSNIRFIIRHAEEIVGCILVAVMVATVSVGVFARFVNVSIVWTDELSRYTFIWTVYLGSVVAVKRKGHIALDFLIRIAPGGFQKAFYFIIQLALLILFSIMFYYGFLLTLSTWDVPTTSLEIPTGIIYAAVPVSCFLMFIYTVIDMWKTLWLGPSIVVDQLDNFDGKGI
ncbi:TRAP transporter small permease [Ammoniphilus resinae]|uniref:TRAP-type C4-dicarboxylate transport system permease small subunit n=1 Tax=Ammoniphilus resinae TaxID=861532 RepID=A0ABS4GWB4_9BACL|nr:TRAP transporter small permease [Ammoniphilus resinae]MBP1934564.1 TRAP-type C4-dicarboxylate transport system permease small subunit [Ammoniphilus resinae]